MYQASDGKPHLLSGSLDCSLLSRLPSPANEPLSLLSLTDDCFASVLENVSAPELLVLGAVCRHLRAALDDGAHWEGAFRRRFEPVARLLFRGEMPLPPVRQLPARGRGGACWRLHYRSFRRSWMEPGGHGRLLLCIHGRVYDATEYMLEHPGDPNVLRASAGRDATQAFKHVGLSSGTF
uniref:Cytochrome b5 heme-binding domain-containing protein n=1 Tax=Emiliania huxleyi TaxID=2903 RepID=A0A7S3SU40_EMIHU|mmetsp:Transcript_37073/g.110317  ORF Transcript_37073/g.110317 Transcript_37073/m.110317 type:complete len:180 (-) Transcript_37073:29-568(-)